MISVSQALALCLAQVSPLSTQPVPLADAASRVLRADAIAQRDQPPFHASAMDGYACFQSDVAPGASLRVVGEAAAGHVWQGTLNTGEALRIFTGAPLPEGADRVVIQEDVVRDGDHITLSENLSESSYVRPAGADFHAGFALPAPRRISASDTALLAAMNVAKVTVTRAPRVALITTGDELVMPGDIPRADQIIASNIFALKAMLEAAGAQVTRVPIAPDTQAGLTQAFAAADDAQADIIVSIGGASVGDHDLLADFTASLGFDLAFHKIAMRPGKPLMSGRAGNRAYLGLPGNPVSAIVCGHLFLLPMVRRCLGLNVVEPQALQAVLSKPIGSNGPRAHYMRAQLSQDGTTQKVAALDRQDSALLTVLTQANALLIRPPHDPARDAGEIVNFIPL